MHHLTVGKHSEALHGQRRLPVSVSLLAHERVVLLLWQAGVLDSSRTTALANDNLLGMVWLSAEKSTAARYLSSG